jgi:uncharacterized membrane protein
MPIAENATARLEAFSDGVFAVAITLLVLGLHVQAKQGHLAHALGSEWPHYATYVVSFLTIGIIWMNHHAQFERIVRADSMSLLLSMPERCSRCRSRSSPHICGARTPVSSPSG